MRVSALKFGGFEGGDGWFSWEGEESTCFPSLTGWWQLKYFLFSPQTLGKMNPFWRAYVSNGLKPPASQESKSIFTLWCFFDIFVRIYYWKSHVLIGKSKAGISKTTSYLCPGSIDGMLTPQKPPHTHPKVYAFSIWKFLLIAGKSMIYSDPFIIICVTSCSLWCFKVVVLLIHLPPLAPVRPHV